MKVLLVIPRRPSENILPQEDIGLAYVAAADIPTKGAVVSYVKRISSIAKK